MQTRPRSYAFCGGAFGDEGKGRIVDEYVSELARQGRVVVYRDNGGANAGHTVTLPDGQKIALHQLPSGVFCDQATVVLGKGMVIHPNDLLLEFKEVERLRDHYPLAKIMIDEMAVLSLDTHRAFEAALKQWEEGGKGSTGRGISPAYMDVLLRHPVRMRDLAHFNQLKLEKHYRLYEALVEGLGGNLAEMAVPSLSGKDQVVGELSDFIQRLKRQAKKLKPYCSDVSGFITETWRDHNVGYVFEKAQAIGLDARWGVYPDITASDTTFEGIHAATEGVVDPLEIETKAAVIKATYMSSVGTRVLPTMMQDEVAHRIREDAHEYGATTRRPRDIAYLDLPALRFYAQVGRINAFVLTHMDISYLDQPVKICTDYQLNGQPVAYRPDQEFLSQVIPVYTELEPWDGQALAKVTAAAQIPAAAKKFLSFMSEKLGSEIIIITTGPQRDQSIRL